MLSQGLDCVIAAGAIGFGERCVDFVVADLVKQNGCTALAAAQAGDQVVLALRNALGDRALAEGADWIFHAAEFAQ